MRLAWAGSWLLLALSVVQAAKPKTWLAYAYEQLKERLDGATVVKLYLPVVALTDGVAWKRVDQRQHRPKAGGVRTVRTFPRAKIVPKMYAPIGQGLSAQGFLAFYVYSLLNPSSGRLAFEADGRLTSGQLVAIAEWGEPPSTLLHSFDLECGRRTEFKCPQCV